MLASFSFICSLVIISPVITFATRFLVLDSYLSQLSTQYFFPFRQLKPYQTRSVMAFLITVQGHLHTNRDCDNVWTFILTDATFKSAEIQETLSKVNLLSPLSFVCVNLNNRPCNWLEYHGCKHFIRIEYGIWFCSYWIWNMAANILSVFLDI
jgi:hypothetical protein